MKVAVLLVIVRSSMTAHRAQKSRELTTRQSWHAAVAQVRPILLACILGTTALPTA